MKNRFLLFSLFIICFFPGFCKSFAGNLLTREGVVANADKVATWQTANFTYREFSNLHDYGIASWANSVLYIGLMEWAQTGTTGNDYYEWLYGIGTKSNWKLNGIYPYHADEFCVSQFYASMYNKYKEDKMIADTKTRIDWILSNPPSSSMLSSNKQAWTWCDALFMAPPVYVQMASITGDSKYLEFMNTEFRKTSDYLFDETAKLFFRDASYFGKTEANGEKVFWGRGNGWVLAGIANILKYLPDDFDSTAFYEDLFRELAMRLIQLQDETGAWHASLLDPDSYPAPETSATSLITYALAYGINNGLLTNEEALKPVLKAWSRLCAAIHDDGKLGFIQPIGQDPKSITKDMTAPFGVGAFLLAASEVYKLLGNDIQLDVEICFEEESLELIKGDCKQLKVIFFPDVDDEKIEWSSSDSSIVEVSADGTICCVGEGSATITATYVYDKTKTANCLVAVKIIEYSKNVFFDFGTTTSQVSPGAVKVSSKTLFSENGIYGWLPAVGLGERFLSKPADNIELRGFIVGPYAATFKVLLENGIYEITVTQGDADYPHEYMIVKANGETKLEDVTSKRGSYEINTFNVEIENNSLELEFSKIKQGDPNWAVNSVRIINKLITGWDNDLSLEEFSHPETVVSIYTMRGEVIMQDKRGNENLQAIVQKANLPKGIFLLHLCWDNRMKVIKICT